MLLSRSTIPPAILVLHGETHTRNLIATALGSTGARVTSAAGGRDVLPHLTNQPPDLIICSQELQDLYGLSFVRYLRVTSETKRIPLLLLLSDQVATDRATRMGLRRSEYLAAPFDLHALLGRVQSRLGLLPDDGAARLRQGVRAEQLREILSATTGSLGVHLKKDWAYILFFRDMARRGHVPLDHLPRAIDILAAGPGTAVIDLLFASLDEPTRYAALAAHCGLEQAQLDTLDHGAARRISLFDARRWEALPIAEQNGHLTVAIANPLDEDARRALTDAVTPLQVRWAVAPRGHILAAIDRTLGAKRLGDYLREAGAISETRLREALALAQQAGIRVGQALVHLGHLDDSQLARLLAAQQGLATHDLSSAQVQPAVARLLPEADARRLRALPVAINGEGTTIAVVDPLDQSALGELHTLLGRPVTPVVAAEQAFERALDELYHEEYAHRCTQALLTRSPEDSAYRVLTYPQKIVLCLLLIVSLGWLMIEPLGFLTVFNAVVVVLTSVYSAHRIYLVSRALMHRLEVPVSSEELMAVEDHTLPPYTILVPIYREATVLPDLMQSLTRLDYPLAKLDIKLLLELDDIETIETARSLGLPPNVELVFIPPVAPKTKPKACNYGLIKAKGEFVVIYDAEDMPEPDQLKKVIAAFRKVGREVACIQAKLNYFNRDQNLLTRWFTIEYSMWFDLFLPGLDASKAPVPLGGTSNHFRRDYLEQLGAWDPYNVTEDADLGVRLYKQGFKTALIDSTTYEEANSQIGNWIRQRSRWVKGYIQTWLVHMRNPVALWRALGPRGFFGFNMTIAGTFLSFLLNPIYWALTTLWLLTETGVIQQMFPPLIFYLGALNLFLGNFTFAFMCAAGCMRRRLYGMVKYALLSPIYWILISIGAWKGFLQLFTRPFYWEKTIHGLHKQKPNETHHATSAVTS
jgi:glycosyltransferase XagB